MFKTRIFTKYNRKVEMMNSLRSGSDEDVQKIRKSVEEMEKHVEELFPWSSHQTMFHNNGVKKTPVYDCDEQCNGRGHVL